MLTRAPEILARWIADIGPILGIPEDDWPGIVADQHAAVMRWAAHIANPEDLETYVFLRRHAARGFIAQFPASRFITAQMRFAQLVGHALRDTLVDDAVRYGRLATLLFQELAIRILHITDFFVEGREQLLLEQEASYRRAVDHAPACILRIGTADGRVVDANTV